MLDAWKPRLRYVSPWLFTALLTSLVLAVTANEFWHGLPSSTKRLKPASHGGPVGEPPHSLETAL